MKILVICQYYYPEQFRINDICEEFVKRGNDVTVLTGLPNYPSGIVSNEYKFFRKRKEKINGVSIIRCWEIGRRRGAIFRILNYCSYLLSASIKAFLLPKNFDCVFVYQLSPVTMAMPGILYKKKNKKKLHLYCLDLWPASLTAGGIKENSRFYKIMKKISIWIYRKADSILISSKKFKDYIENYLYIKDKKITYLPQYAEELYTDIEKSSKNSENTNFLFAGNVGEAQSVETIIMAANELKNDKKIKIHIVGDGSSLEKCKELSNNFELENVIFYGRQPIEKMKDYYQMADAMLVTLKKDDIISMTLPGKVQSYMAAGKPIIGAIDGETKNVIENAKCGYCVESEHYIELSNIIRKFKEDSKEKQKRMAENSYQYYIQNFSKENYMLKLLNIL